MLYFRYGVGKRMSLKHTRAIIDAIHNGELDKAEFVSTPIFGLQVSYLPRAAAHSCVCIHF
jgi:ATP-dependent phosphoenolpyruvate carboxykinase